MKTKTKRTERLVKMRTPAGDIIEVPAVFFEPYHNAQYRRRVDYEPTTTRKYRCTFLPGVQPPEYYEAKARKKAEYSAKMAVARKRAWDKAKQDGIIQESYFPDGEIVTLDI